MLSGLMMDYPLTLNTIVEHASRMTPRKDDQNQAARRGLARIQLRGFSSARPTAGECTGSAGR